MLLLVAKPRLVPDTGFLLSFLAVGCIAGLAIPVLERTIQTATKALRDWKDVTRDIGLTPLQVQFRLDLRDAMGILTKPFHEGTKGVVEKIVSMFAEFGLRRGRFSFFR